MNAPENAATDHEARVVLDVAEGETQEPRAQTVWLTRLPGVDDDRGDWRIHNDRREFVHLTASELGDILGAVARFAAPRARS